jgi:tRNA G18 (ribose-2'-O)-methylase SpoU
MRKHPLTIVLDNIRSALNVGAIFRTCDAAGISKLYLTGISPSPPHKKIPKTALGAIEMVHWEYKDDTLELIKELKKQGNEIISVELTEQAQNYWDYRYSKPTTLVFGNEISGVSNEILSLSDTTVYVPMYGQKESLNVATTVGITTYEVIRQWESKNEVQLP